MLPLFGIIALIVISGVLASTETFIFWIATESANPSLNVAPGSVFVLDEKSETAFARPGTCASTMLYARIRSINSTTMVEPLLLQKLQSKFFVRKPRNWFLTSPDEMRKTFSVKNNAINFLQKIYILSSDSLKVFDPKETGANVLDSSTFDFFKKSSIISTNLLQWWLALHRMDVLLVRFCESQCCCASPEKIFYGFLKITHLSVFYFEFDVFPEKLIEKQGFFSFTFRN